MNKTTESHLLGWQSSPNTRGTIDIIWACASTIFACVWVMLHLNIPGPTESRTKILLRKSKWFILAMLAPELLMLFAGGQWAAAKRSVAVMKSKGEEKVEWTMAHAFYAESGGFMLHLRDDTSFPVTAAQIHWLVKEGWIERPSIEAEEIEEKSKADGYAKIVAGAQSLWFVIQIIARGVDRLAVTLLELSTICLMTCMASALFFWYHKPLDVSSSVPIACDRTMADVYCHGANGVKKQYKYTPLDFCDPIEYSSPQFPGNRIWSEQTRPLSRIPNDRDSLLHNWTVLLVLSVPTAAFGALQLIAWNFAFPTRAEQLLWRWTCVGGCVVLGTGCFLEAAAIVASGFKLAGMETFHRYKTRWPWCMLFLGAGFLYVVARVIVITEVIISLRALPRGCFQTVNWTSVLPHV